MRYIAPANEQREQNKENTGTRQSSQSPIQRTTKTIKNEATNKRNTTVMNKNIDVIIL